MEECSQVILGLCAEIRFVSDRSTGVFATPDGCAAYQLTNPGGAIAGNWKQVWLQLVGALFIIGLNIVMTSIILGVLQFAVPLRMSEAALLIGDDAIHGEEAYAIFHDGQRSLLYDDVERRPHHGNGELSQSMVIEGTAPQHNGRSQVDSRKDSPVSGELKSE